MKTYIWTKLSSSPLFCPIRYDVKYPFDERKAELKWENGSVEHKKKTTTKLAHLLESLIFTPLSIKTIKLQRLSNFLVLHIKIVSFLSLLIKIFFFQHFILSFPLRIYFYLTYEMGMDIFLGGRETMNETIITYQNMSKAIINFEFMGKVWVIIKYLIRKKINPINQLTIK